MCEWKDVEVRGYKLRVSRSGEVLLPEKKTEHHCIRLGKQMTVTSTFKERILKPTKNQMGYLEVKFVHKRKAYKFAVHRLVGMAFVHGFTEGLVINHKDGNKLNNAPENLEWITLAKNSRHAWSSGLVNFHGENSPLAKLTEHKVLHIRKLLAANAPVTSIAVVSGVSNAAIIKIREGRSWAHLA